MEKERYSHKAFGQLAISRVNGKANFYGSELEQDHYISIEVNQSEVERDLSRDWYFNTGKLPLLRVRMSAIQFSEAITSFNQGGGIPCTIEMVDSKPVDKMPEQESRKEFVHRKFRDRMKMFADSIRENQQKAQAIVKKKTLSKQDVFDLNHKLEWLTIELERNIPYFIECFQDTADQVVNEAKLEVENAIQNKINMLGLDALHEQNKLLK